MQPIVCAPQFRPELATIHRYPDAEPQHERLHWRATLDRLRILTARHAPQSTDCPHHLDHLAMDCPHQQRSLPSLILRHARSLTPDDRHWLAALTTAHLDLFTIEGLDGHTPIARQMLTDTLFPLADWEDAPPLAPGQLIATRVVRAPHHHAWMATAPILIDRTLVDDLLAALWRAFTHGPYPSWRPFMRDLGARILLSYLDASPPPENFQASIVPADWHALDDAFHLLESAIFNHDLPAHLPANLGFGRQARVVDLTPGPLLLLQTHAASPQRSPWLRARRVDPDHLDLDALDALLDAGLSPHDHGAVIVEATDPLGRRRDIHPDDLRALTAACLTLCVRAPYAQSHHQRPRSSENSRQHAA